MSHHYILANKEWRQKIVRSLFAVQLPENAFATMARADGYQLIHKIYRASEHTDMLSFLREVDATVVDEALTAKRLCEAQVADDNTVLHSALVKWFATQETARLIVNPRSRAPIVRVVPITKVSGKSVHTCNVVFRMSHARWDDVYEHGSGLGTMSRRRRLATPCKQTLINIARKCVGKELEKLLPGTLALIVAEYV